MNITVNPALAKLPFQRFKQWHEKFLAYDPLSAEERYKELGGKVPVKEGGNSPTKEEDPPIKKVKPSNIKEVK